MEKNSAEFKQEGIKKVKFRVVFIKKSGSGLNFSLKTLTDVNQGESKYKNQGNGLTNKFKLLKWRINFREIITNKMAGGEQ